MGKYLNQDSQGNALPADYQGKIGALQKDGAIMATGNEFVPNMICIVDNGRFAAVGYAYSEGEYQEFKRPDGRPKTWMVHPKASEIAK